MLNRLFIPLPLFLKYHQYILIYHLNDIDSSISNLEDSSMNNLQNSIRNIQDSLGTNDNYSYSYGNNINSRLDSIESSIQDL